MNVNLFVTIEGITCGNCAVPFGIESNHLAMLKRTGTLFYCPNGHNISYGDSENERLRREAAANARSMEYINKTLSETRTALYKATDDKERLAKKVKRARAGICTDCNRTFNNVVRHRASKHQSH